MFLLLFVLGLVAFSVYFSSLGLWYVGLVPFLAMIIFFVSFGGFDMLAKKISSFFVKYSLYIFWGILLVGIFGLLKILGISAIYRFFGLSILHLGLWLGSYVFGYKDGKRLFLLGYYFVIFFFLIFLLGEVNIAGIVSFLSFVWVLHFAVTGFLLFVLGIRYEIEDNIWYLFFVLGLGTLFWVILDRVPNTYVALALNTLLLSGVFFGFSYLIQYKPVSKQENHHLNIRRILSGERLTTHLAPSFWFSKVAPFLWKAPKGFHIVLEIINLLLIISVVWMYFAGNIEFGWLEQISYWFVVASFVGNVLLLKQLGYTSIFQHFSLFLVVYSVVYISLFSYFDGHFGSVALWGIIWNVVSTGLIFYAPKFFPKLFSTLDYSGWILIVTLSTCVNVLFLLRGTLDDTHLFLSLLYLGLQGMMIFYAIRFVRKLEA